MVGMVIYNCNISELSMIKANLYESRGRKATGLRFTILNYDSRVAEEG